jgi:predicted nucleic acid-binding protein
MTVVSNTSPVLNLACVGELGLLRQLYGGVSIPEEVSRELMKLKQSNPRFGRIDLPDFVRVVKGSDPIRVQALMLELDEGEAAAISLAIELKAELLLIDEKRGRAAARSLGVAPFGLVGVLVEARKKGFLSAVKPLLQKLEAEAGFWLGTELKRIVLTSVGEEG